MKATLIFFIIIMTVCISIFALLYKSTQEAKGAVKTTPLETFGNPLYVKESVPSSPDSLHRWSLIGTSGHCKVYYRKHIQNRIYWSLCEDGSSSITVK